MSLLVEGFFVCQSEDTVVDVCDGWLEIRAGESAAKR
jgi:hypothetical protein